MTIPEGANFGQYRIIAPLGQGGMATVYRAFQPGLRREVAIKVIAAHLAGDPAFRARFRREAALLARLEHPNIPSVFDYGEQDGQPYIVYRFISGGTLADLMQGPLPMAGVLRSLTPIAAALDFAHARGVVHRDIKPSNVLLTTDRTPIIADFGLARIFEAGMTGFANTTSPSLTEVGAGLGTPAYMAPEQILSRPVDGRPDQYALGIVAYEMLTGSRPYAGETALVLALKHVHEALPLPSSHNPALNAAIDRVFLTVLAKEAGNRFPTCNAFLAALAEAESGAVANADTPPEPSGMFARPTPRPVEPPTSAHAGEAVSVEAPWWRLPVP